LEEDIYHAIEPVLNWIDWLAPVSHLPFDLNSNEIAVNCLIRNNKVEKVK
jgi:hypothetical protein